MAAAIKPHCHHFKEVDFSTLFASEVAGMTFITLLQNHQKADRRESGVSIFSGTHRVCRYYFAYSFSNSFLNSK